MTKLTTERLENIATWREKYGNGANVMIPAEEAELMARQLLAYEQAAEKPYGYLEPYDFPRTTATLYPEKDRYAVMPIYAAPVLPKQPVKPVMFIDGDISSDDAEKLAALIREFALDEETEEQQNEPQNIPENIPVPLELRYGDNVLWFLNELASFDASDIDCDGFDVYGEDRNGTEGCATISITELAADAAKLLSAQPVSEPYKFHQGWIKGQFAYQDLFNAIGAAVVSKHPSIEISVKAFEDSMLAAAPVQESE